MLVNFKFYSLLFLMVVSFLFSINELYKFVFVDLKNFDREKGQYIEKIYLNSFLLYFVIGFILMKVIENYDQIEPFL